MRRFFLTLLSCLLLPALAIASPAVPEVTAKSAIVIEASTGKVLYQKQAEETRYPASTTKIMTLITALEHGNLNDIVTASTSAASTEGSSLWLSAGEKMPMLDLLYGVMLVSGNDATVAVAEHIAGSVEAFAKLMTEKAHTIGAINTNFTNSSGLPDPKHVTTAHDLARIAAYGYKNPLFAQIVSTEHKVIPWPGKDYDRDLYNENKMLWLYEGGNGIKTGYTDAAGRCLVSGAKRNGIQLVAVVLDSERMWDDSIALLDYGFAQVRPQILYKQGEIMKTVRVTNGKSENLRLVTSRDISVPISEDDKDNFHTVIEAPAKVDAPIIAGQKLGQVKTLYKNTEIAAVDLVAAESVERKTFFGMLWGSLWNFFTFIVRNIA